MVLPYSPRTTWDHTVDLGINNVRGFDGNPYTGTHVRVIPKTIIDVGPKGLLFNNLASVTIFGGHFRPTERPTYVSGVVGPGAFTFNTVGEVYLEGVQIDCTNMGVGDAIYLAAKTANTVFTAQNCRFDNVQGLESGFHGDVFQAGSDTQGIGGPVRFYNCTFTCNYQGIFTDPQVGADSSTNRISSLIMTRVNGRRTSIQTPSPILYYFYSHATDYTSSTLAYPITLNEVWADGTGSQVVEDTVWPSTTAGSASQFPTTTHRAVAATDTRGRYVHWPGMQDAGKALSGKVYQGTPPEGDFAPADRIGLSYVKGTDFAVAVDPSNPTSFTSYTNLLRPGSGTWTTGGPGTLTVDTVTNQITFITDGTGTAFARRSFATVVNKRYELTWSNDTTPLMSRAVGTGAGLTDILATAVSVTGDNKVEFTATTETTWVNFSRSTAATVTISNPMVQEVVAGAAPARRLNGKNSYFSLDAQNNAMRIANNNWFIGGWMAFNYMPAGGFYIMDFGRLDPDSTSGGAARVRLGWDAAATKLFASSANTTAVVYRENYIVAPLQVDTWYFVGVTAQTNADILVLLNEQKGSAYSGTVIPTVSASDICRFLQIGARVAPTRTQFAPIRLSNWIWCSNWIPSDSQLSSMAQGVPVSQIAGFTPPAGGNLYHWPMQASGNEPSTREAATLISVSDFGSPIAVPGPLLQSSTPTTSDAPLDIIMT